MHDITQNKGLKCVCGSKKAADSCCLPYIKGLQQPATAEQLMRSRYSAFVMAEESYLLDSWHVSTRPASLDLPQSTKWLGLKVLKAGKQKNNTAEVEFIARFNDVTGPGQLHELSHFVRDGKTWFYVDGEQIESAHSSGFKVPGRNQACYCGSGKKYKKCCAQK